MSLSDLIALTKPRITAMVVLTTAVGFLVARPEPSLEIAWLAAAALFGTALLAAGSAALNMWLERDLDSLMQRTAARPLPAGRLEPEIALLLGAVLSALGAGLLASAVNVLTAGLGLLTLFSYLLVYTPLKRRTHWATLVGAVPGAIPPMMGWAAVRGELGAGAWALFAILFFWQLPHFFAIDWMYREEYRKGGFAMLSSTDPTGRRSAFQSILFTGLLVAASVLPWRFQLNSALYALLAVALGTAFLWKVLRFTRARTFDRAKSVMLYSVLYLPALLALLVVDRWI